MIGIGYISLVICNIIYMNGCAGDSGGQESVEDLLTRLANKSLNISNEFGKKNEQEIFKKFETLYKILSDYLNAVHSVKYEDAIRAVSTASDAKLPTSANGTVNTVNEAAFENAVAAAKAVINAVQSANTANTAEAAKYYIAASIAANAATIDSAFAFASSDFKNTNLHEEFKDFKKICSKIESLYRNQSNKN